VAVVIQLPLTYLGAVFPMPNGLYGAPSPVGESSGASIFGGGPTFSLLFWLVNVALTTGVVYLILRVRVARSSVAAGAWALVALIAGYAMQLGVGAGVLPFAGLPIPASVKGVADGRPIHVVFLADALLFVAAYVWLRRRSAANEVGI
jgi:hypothetical protein